MRTRWIQRAVGVTLAGFTGILTVGSIALATPPANGRHYSGGVTGPQPGVAGKPGKVSFDVTRNGQRIVKLVVPVNARCPGITAKTRPPQSARISKQGTFTKPIGLSTSNGRYGHATVTGKFLPRGGEKGTITIVFEHGACGVKWSYKTHD